LEFLSFVDDNEAMAGVVSAVGLLALFLIVMELSQSVSSLWATAMWSVFAAATIAIGLLFAADVPSFDFQNGAQAVNLPHFL
jgi:hypothetical protein